MVACFPWPGWRLQLHSPVKLTQVCYLSRSPRPAVQKRYKQPPFSFPSSSSVNLGELSAMCVCDSNVYLGVNCTVAVELASRKRGRVDGTGIRRPELALVIHAKATPSTLPPSSVHPSISTLQWLYLDYPLATCYRRKLNKQSFLTHSHTPWYYGQEKKTVQLFCHMAERGKCY